MPCLCMHCIRIAILAVSAARAERDRRRRRPDPAGPRPGSGSVVAGLVPLRRGSTQRRRQSPASAGRGPLPERRPSPSPRRRRAQLELELVARARASSISALQLVRRVAIASPSAAGSTSPTWSPAASAGTAVAHLLDRGRRRRSRSSSRRGTRARPRRCGSARRRPRGSCSRARRSRCRRCRPVLLWICVLIPITRPSASSSGPPELPLLIAASVWIAPSMPNVVGRLDRAVERADDPARDRAGETERAADRDHRVADLRPRRSRRARAARRRRPRAGRARRRPIDGSVPTTSASTSRPPGYVIVTDVGVLDDVVVRDDAALVVEDEARALRPVCGAWSPIGTEDRSSWRRRRSTLSLTSS